MALTEEEPITGLDLTSDEQEAYDRNAVDNPEQHAHEEGLTGKEDGKRCE